uniref:Uncharacterized protein n=1 Tax=Mycena chlorophos TaxID=658473 RepID=A0ABQ0M590_MYCCL|nr:predicted protein [Mycena chlorophos]
MSSITSNLKRVRADSNASTSGMAKPPMKKLVLNDREVVPAAPAPAPAPVEKGTPHPIRRVFTTRTDEAN